jgi:F0F1-type ATP synthase membrane subunit b/b'
MNLNTVDISKLPADIRKTYRQLQVLHAEKQIQVEKEKAIAEVKGEVVHLSISVAEKLIKKNLSVEDNKALIDESLSQVKDYEA